jgi:glycosyltransferase A (GT-A) superfamily protein (DUF2064 family)
VPRRPSSSRSGPITASTDPAVVVLALFGEPPDPALDPALRAAVADIAVAWAVRQAAPDWALVSDRVAPAPPGARAFGEPAAEDEVAAALGEALSTHAGPVLLIAPDVPRLDDALAEAALGDLAAGCALSFAPATDSRPYLLALAEASPQSLALVGARDRHREAVFAAAIDLGGDVGLLRSERRLVTSQDAHSLAIDPIVPADLRALAGG